MYFIVQISFSFKKFFKCFSLPFPSFMTMFMCTQSHGGGKHWWHNSVSMDIYSHLQRDHFWELCLVMIQFIWVSYKTQHHVHIVYISIFLKLISVMLHVVSCHIVLYLYKIYTKSNLKFFITYFMCMLCKSRLMYQSICVFVHYHHVLYCIILHAYHMEQFFMFQQFTIMWYHVQYLSHM